MAIYHELVHFTLPELIDAFRGPPPEGDDYAAAYYDEVASLIRAQGEAGIEFLFDVGVHGTGDRLASLLVGLSPLRSNASRLKDMLRRHLCDDHPRVVMAAIDGLRHQGEGGAIDEVLKLRDHPSPYVRGSVLRYVGRFAPDAATPMLIAALDDADPIVRGTAIDELDELGVGDAMVLLCPLLADPDPDVRHAAQLALER